MSVLTTSTASTQVLPTDPAALWELSNGILYAVARKVRRAVRLQLAGHGRGEAEAEELVNDAFVTFLDALPRFNPATAKMTTFVYGLARRPMWLVARAEFYGVTPEQLHRMDVAKRTPVYHRGERALRVAPAAVEDGDERESVRKVAVIRRRLPHPDHCLLTMYLQENGNFSAVARRLDRHPEGIRGRYLRLFRRIRRQFGAA